ncbi:MAG: citrate lyase holo-[acyl-carrier protein] synthase [Acholeplasmataceae bacterium]|nr:citrate lyase holo-[acyl-carrier protein] synthase [Acholeplasmataceae bacterium]
MTDSLLNAREKRIDFIKSLLSETHLTILVKANIPGQNKNINEAYLLVRLFCFEVNKIYPNNSFEVYESLDGPYAIFSINSLDLISTKLELIGLEEKHPLGRFIDLDLFGTSMNSISRKELNIEDRKCYLCNQYARYCSRNKTHSIESLLSFIKTNVFKYLSVSIEQSIQNSILLELNMEHKFGLVTPTSNGSHPDMDYHLMFNAQKAILPYLTKLFELGYQAEDLIQLLQEARIIGLKAEERMLKVTRGINAYKGLIFVLGLSILSTGYVLSHDQSFNSIFDMIQSITKDIEDEFKNPPTTSGLKAYTMYGYKGIRGEVKKGIPSVQSALKLIKDHQVKDLHLLLKHLILVSEDTVFIKRALTKERYLLFKNEIRYLDVSSLEQQIRFTQKAIKENLSFGGSADLLVTTLYLNSIAYLYK